MQQELLIMSRGPMCTIRQHLKYDQWYPYYWLKNTDVGGYGDYPPSVLFQLYLELEDFIQILEV